MLWINNNNYSICQENTKIRPTSDTFCNKYVENWGIKYGPNLVCPDYFYEIVCYMSSNRLNLTISCFFLQIWLKFDTLGNIKFGDPRP